MPRPRVRPEDRQRAAKACLSCKASKKRCDAQQPCSNCIRRRATSSCTYAEPSAAFTTRKLNSSPTQSNDAGPSLAHEAGLARPYPVYNTALDGHGRPLEAAPTPRSLTGGRLLLNSKGERVYLGETASLSFLQFLRQTLRQQMGPSVFTDSSRRNVMLEIESPEATTDLIAEDDGQRRALIDVFYAATNGLVDAFSRDEMEDYLLRDEAVETGRHQYAGAALDVAIAIGSQCRASSAADVQLAVKYFSRAQKTALAGGLEDPSLDMVRCFLLMAFYMFGACRRNAALMYLCVASQAASTLGLHVTELSGQFTSEEQLARLRVLRSLRTLDVISHAILGRPPSTSSMRLRSQSLGMFNAHDGAARSITVLASFEAASYIADVAQHLETHETIEVLTAKAFLDKLHQWSASLPDEIRQFRRDAAIPLTVRDQEVIIGSIHVSCVYYFGVMLVTRPFLIAHLMTLLQKSAASAPEPSDMDLPAPEQSEVTKLAQACIDSAILMAQMCQSALTSGVLLNSMCILKAWMFATGLVLGFTMFAEGESRFEMDKAFSGACEVLKSLATHSPQAGHYHDILTAFADAIQRHRQDVSRERRRSQNPYVNQILTFDVTPFALPSQATASPRPFPRPLDDPMGKESALETRTASEDELEAPEPNLDAFQIPWEPRHELDFGLFGWDDVAMQISESYSFDSDGLWTAG